ncbi:PPPDE peptidase, putative [Plasmodium malariae]|uniref:PPPDE peptidase, putative n=1 Tax=Plasmodium malariae TaxID=5858 RepID=A0A1C3KBL6_PLAMA|nr:PPPDE peptidase, putative [Plasmodium malariae]
MNVWLHTYTLDVPFFLKNVRHTGIELFGREYTFSMDGIITCKPKNSTVGQYCKSYELKCIKLSYSQFSEILNAIGKIYRPNTYNFIYKNCNHFCDDLFELLSGKRLFHTFMFYSRLGKIFGNFKNVALCGYINSMEISRNDKTLYIYALNLSKSILKKNKNKRAVLYINDINDFSDIDDINDINNFNEDYHQNYVTTPLYVVPYRTYASYPCVDQNIYYTENCVNNSMDDLNDGMHNIFHHNSQFDNMYFFRTSGNFSMI